MRTADIKTENTLLKTIAGATPSSRDKDITLSPLMAIDKLQKLSKDFREQWLYYSPWLVLKDGWRVTSDTLVGQILEEIKMHGEPIGIVGIAELKHYKRDAVLRLYFPKDKKSRAVVDASAQDAITQRNELVSGVFSAEVFLDEAGAITMHYSFMPEQPALEPGAKRVGALSYKHDGKMVSYFHGPAYQKQYADVMEQAKEHFRDVIKKLYEMQREQLQKS